MKRSLLFAAAIVTTVLALQVMLAGIILTFIGLVTLLGAGGVLAWAWTTITAGSATKQAIRHASDEFDQVMQRAGAAYATRERAKNRPV